MGVKEFIELYPIMLRALWYIETQSAKRALDAIKILHGKHKSIVTLYLEESDPLHDQLIAQLVLIKLTET